MSHTATIKSFNAKKGFGFISYNDTDVFVHLRDCSDGGVPQTGDTVTFEMEESASKPGTFKASKVTGGTGTMPDLGGGDKGKGKGGAPGTGAFFGTCKSYNDTKAWGFIVYEGQDVFFHLKDMQDGSAPQAGNSLQFDLEDNPQKPGQLKAKNVTGGTGWPQGPKGDGKDGGKGKGYGPAWGADPWGGWGGKGDWGPYGGGWGMDGGWGKGGGMDWGKGWGGGKGDGWGGGKDAWGGGKDAWGGGKDAWGGGKDAWGGGKGKDNGWGGGGMGKGDGMGKDGKGKGKPAAKGKGEIFQRMQGAPQGW